MQSLKRNFTFIGFALTLLIVGFGLGQYFLQKSYQQHLEANYRRSLREFATHIDNLEVGLTQARLATGSRQIHTIAADLHSQLYAAQANLSQLPLGEIDLTNIKQIMANAHRQVNFYSAGELATADLHGLYEQIQFINSEVQSLLQSKEADRPWITWGRYFSASLTFSDGLTTALSAINKGLVTITGFENVPYKAGGKIVGEEITSQAAVAIARTFSGRTDLEFSVTNQGEGEIPAYTVSATASEGEIITVEVSRQGGLVLWMLNSQTVVEQRLDAKEMASFATAFLTERGFSEVYMTDVQILQNRATLTFVPVRNGILHYAEPLKVQVSAADGQILGFHGLLYYLAQSRQGSIDAPLSNGEPVTSSLHPDAQVINHQLALVTNEFDEEVLTHRLGVDYGGEYFLIYINSQTGEEEKIVPVTSADFF